jgi:hypothetical protein
MPRQRRGVQRMRPRQAQLPLLHHTAAVSTAGSPAAVDATMDSSLPLEPIAINTTHSPASASSTTSHATPARPGRAAARSGAIRATRIAEPSAAPGCRLCLDQRRALLLLAQAAVRLRQLPRLGHLH